MDNFISIVFDEKPDNKFSRTFLACFENLNESLLEDETDYVVFESTGNKTVYRIGISESPDDAEAEKLADHLYTHLYTQGYDNFDIEITANNLSENTNIDIIKSLVDPAAQQRMSQSQSAKRGGKDKALANLKNAHMFDDPISMVKTALNIGATPEEVAQNLSPKADLSKAATSDQIAQQRADDPFLQTNYSAEGLEESNPFTDARMNAIKAGKDTFTVDGKTYKVTGDTSDEEAADEETLDERQRLDPKCWKGYRKDGTKMKDGVRVNNCVKVGEGEYTWEGDLEMLYDDEEMLDEAEYQGRTVKLGKPMRGDVKKFKVYVKNPKGNVVKVNFGDPDMRIKKSNPARRRSFRARHNCDSPGPRHKARYWSCRKW